MTCRLSTSDQQLQCLSSVPVQNQAEWWRVSFATIHSFMTERLTQHSREKFQVKVSDEGLNNYNIYIERAPHQPKVTWFSCGSPILIKMEFASVCGFSGGRKTGRELPGEKPGQIARTNIKLNPYMILGQNRTRAHTPGPYAY